MGTEPRPGPSPLKVSFFFTLGLLAGVGLAFPEVPGSLLFLRDALVGLGPIGIVVLLGCFMVLPLALGMFGLWRAIKS